MTDLRLNHSTEAVRVQSCLALHIRVLHMGGQARLQDAWYPQQMLPEQGLFSKATSAHGWSSCNKGLRCALGSLLLVCQSSPHEHSGNSLEIKAAFILHAEKKKKKKIHLDWIIGRNFFVTDAWMWTTKSGRRDVLRVWGCARINSRNVEVGLWKS